MATTKIAWTATFRRLKTPPQRSHNAGEVSMPIRTAFATMTARDPRWNQRLDATRRWPESA
jgi:hypothetical protein